MQQSSKLTLHPQWNEHWRRKKKTKIEDDNDDDDENKNFQPWSMKETWFEI